MTSLGFSVGTCSPPSEQRKGRSFVSSSLTKADAINLRSKQKVSDHELSFVQPASCGRREAIIGFGVCIGLVDNVSAFAETSSCEFSVSPSGLAFCDKVVGYGPAAVKGQLIKVIISQTILPLLYDVRSLLNISHAGTLCGEVGEWESL